MNRVRAAWRPWGVRIVLGLLVFGAVGWALGGRLRLVGATLLLVAPAVALVLRLRTDPLDGPGIYGLAMIPYFGITSLGWLGTPPTPGPTLTRADVSNTLLLLAAGLALFAVGAQLAGRPQRARDRWNGSDGPSIRAVMVAFAIGASAPIAGLALSSYGYVTNLDGSARTVRLVQLFSSISVIGAAATGALALMFFAGGGKARYRALLLMIVIQAVLGFTAGYKGLVLEPLLVTFLAYVCVKRRLPWGAVGLTAVVTLVVILPLNTAYRAVLRERQVGVGTTKAVRDAFSDPGQYRPDRVMHDAYIFGMKRFRLIDSAALIVHRTPQDFAWGDGSHYWTLPAILAVPRAFWPSKPALDTSEQFSTTYWEFRRADHTATGLTQFGDLYRNFGLVGSWIGMLIWGAILGGATRLARRWPSPRMTLIWMFTILRVVIYLESDLPFLVAYTARSLPVVAIVAWLLLPGATSEPGYRRLSRGLRLRPSTRLGRS